jgi:ABC-2 type transport system ATP-binding protein
MLAVQGISKRYGPVVAVDEISFGIDRGEVVGFLGPNGAGKTTTMKMLNGTLQPDEGEVRFDGRPIAEDLTGAKRRIGYLPERGALYEDMLVSEYLEYEAELRDLAGGAFRSALAAAVQETGIEEVYHRPIVELSKGYRQRVGLAGAILHRPDVLILDEPTEGLDPNQRVGIRSLINELGEDRTVLLSTHVMGEVEATCDRLLVIHRGRLVADGGVDELLSAGRGGDRYVVEVEGAGVEERLAELPEVTSTMSEALEDRSRVELVATGEDLRPRISRIAAEEGWTLWELRREQASLEELFQRLTVEEQPEGLEGAGSRWEGGSA